MYRLTIHTAQEKSQWLALAASLLVVTISISMTLLWPPAGQAFDLGPQPPLSFASGNYQSPRHCRECHEAEFQAWSGTSHAKAAFDPVFQVYLQLAEEPGECFACHTTGYNSATGQFVLSGVTCEACHGPYRAEHPGESMMIAPPKELCGTCHTGTLAEWTSSRHSQADVTCTACHEVHTQKIHSADNTNALCTGCHQHGSQDAIYIIHREAEVSCIDCHVTCPGDDTSGAEGGRAATGHAFSVLVSTCSDCHLLPLGPDAASP